MDSRISRRSLLLASAAFVGCGRRKAPRISGYCFVATRGNNAVAVVSLENFRVLARIPLDAAPVAVLSHPRQAKVLALAPDNGTVYELDAATNKVSRRARGGNQALGMRLSPSGKALWVLYRVPAQLVEVPLDSFKPGRTIRLSAPPEGFDVVMHGPRQVPLAAVVSRQNGSITVASLVSASIENVLTPHDEPSLVSFQSDGTQVIAGSWKERSVTMLDTATGKTVVRLPLPLAPRQFCNSGDGGQVFITGDGMDAVVVLYPYQTEISQTILAGRTPGAMMATPDGMKPSYLMVANPSTDGITVLDISTYTLVAVVQVGQGPGQIVLTPDRQYALVLDEKSGDIAVVRLLALTTAPNGAHRRFLSAPIFTLISVGEQPVSAAFVS